MFSSVIGSLSPVSFLNAQPRIAIFFPVILSPYQPIAQGLFLFCGSGSRVEQGVNNFTCESLLLVLILQTFAYGNRGFQAHHVDHRTPVLADFGQVKRLGQVDQVEDVLLEARTTETLAEP